MSNAQQQREAFEDALSIVIYDVESMLVDKNRRYGNSALNPLRVFSKADWKEQIHVRMDDKLSRLRSSQGDDTEDAKLDLLGYLILERVGEALATHAAEAEAKWEEVGDVTPADRAA